MRKKKILMCNESSMLSTGYSTYGYEVLTRLFNTGKYELAELAAYGAPEDLNSTNIPWKYFPVLPPKNKPELRARYESKATNKFGEFIFDEVCAIFKPDIVCVPPGELIMTVNGYKPIEEIQMDELVLTHNGRWMPVKATMRKQHTGEIVNIFYNGCNEPLKLTGNHPVLVYRKRNQTNQKKSLEKIYAGVKPEFISADDVKTGDLIVINPPVENNPYHSIITTDYLKQFIVKEDRVATGIHEYDATIPLNISLNKKMGMLIGYYIGDGHIPKDEKSVDFTFHEEETRFIDEVCQIILEIFDLKCTTTNDKDKKSVRVNINSTLLSKFLSGLVGRTAKKHIPKEIWLGTKEAKEGVLEGLVKSDGCYKTNTISISTASRKLANEYRMLCSSLNIPTSISKGPGASYDVCGYGDSAKIMHELVNKHDSINGLISDGKKPRRVQIINGHIVSSIRRIRKYQYNGQVYNLDVDIDHSYVVQQACVHNCDIRDWWMMEFEERSPARPYYHWVIMPTVDSAPQHDDWISTFMNADGVFAYSDWGLDVLNKQSNNRIKTQCSAPPGANLRDYKCLNKTEVRKKIGIPDDAIVIGTVMRNQLRKLYPDLMESFAKFLQEAPPEIASKAYLYIHCCYPDVGWDIPRLLKEHGIGARTYFTYQCTKCKDIYPSRFQDGRAPCRFCGEHSAFLPDIKTGVPSTILNEIMAMFDVYVQYATNEGFGMPQVEAAASGTPIMAVDYSAMSDVVRKLKGTPLKVQRLFRDIHTESYRALPDNDFLVKSLIDFFKQPKELRLQQGVIASNEVAKHYTWEKTTKIWENYFDSVIPLDRWNEPARISEPDLNVPSNLSDTEFVNWAFNKIGNRPDLINSYLATKVTRDLGLGVCINGLPNILVDPEYSNESFGTYGSFTREHLASRLVNLCQMKNIFEKRRTL